MPWTPKDAGRHKAGLTPAQQKTWATIANSVLADCEADGGTDCEGKAIRIANSRVGKALAPTPAYVDLRADITKADDSLQRVFGWVSIAVRKDGEVVIDLQGDVIEIADLEEAWYDYVVASGDLNFEHVGPPRGHLIEALVVTPEKLESLGLAPNSLPLGAWAGFHIPNAADYAVIKQRGYLMFSIEGEAYREEIP